MFTSLRFSHDRAHLHPEEIAAVEATADMSRTPKQITKGCCLTRVPLNHWTKVKQPMSLEHRVLLRMLLRAIGTINNIGFGNRDIGY